MYSENGFSSLTSSQILTSFLPHPLISISFLSLFRIENVYFNNNNDNNNINKVRPENKHTKKHKKYI